MEITSKSGDVVNNEKKSQIYVLEDGKWCEWRLLGGCPKLVWTETKGASCSFLKSKENNALKPRTEHDGQWWTLKEGCAGRGDSELKYLEARALQTSVSYLTYIWVTLKRWEQAK